MGQTKILLAVLGIVLVGGIGYGVYNYVQSDDDQPTNNPQTDSTNEATEQNQTNSGDETVEGTLVSGFPGSKVPLYRGDIIESKRTTSSSGQTEYNVRISTADSFDKVDDWTRTSYVNEGWDIRSESKTLLGGVMLIAHSDEYINTITYDSQGEEVLINYGITAK